MKLLVLSNMYPSDDYVFFGIYVRNFVETTRKNGINVDKVVIEGRGKGAPDKIKRYLNYIFNSLKMITQGDFDAIYIHSASLALIPVTLSLPFIRKPVIINAHGTDLLDQSKFSKLVRSINYRTIKKASLLVLPSHYYSKQIEPKLIGAKNIHISPSGGINRNIFRRQEHRPLSEKTIRFGYVSRVDQGKGWDTFILALSKLNSQNPEIEFKASLVGVGSQVKDMLHMINEEGLDKKITYLDQMPHESLPNFYNSIDAFIFPTQLNESLGLVGLEAMCCGTPVIASKIGGINDYLKDKENGFLFPPGDTDSLYRKILEFCLLSTEERNALSDKAILTTQEYDSATVSRKLEDKIREICSKTRII